MLRSPPFISRRSRPVHFPADREEIKHFSISHLGLPCNQAQVQTNPTNAPNPVPPENYSSRLSFKFKPIVITATVQLGGNTERGTDVQGHECSPDVLGSWDLILIAVLLPGVACRELSALLCCKITRLKEERRKKEPDAVYLSVSLRIMTVSCLRPPLGTVLIKSHPSTHLSTKKVNNTLARNHKLTRLFVMTQPRCETTDSEGRKRILRLLFIGCTSAHFAL